MLSYIARLQARTVWQPCVARIGISKSVVIHCRFSLVANRVACSTLMKDKRTMAITNTETNGDSAVNAVHRHVDSAGASLHSTIDKVADPARNAVDRMSSAAHESVDKLADAAGNTADRFADQTRRVAEAPQRALQSTKGWVQDQPLEAVGAALAIGFIIGRLTSR